jgi:hypothetical protein
VDVKTFNSTNLYQILDVKGKLDLNTQVLIND